MSVHKFPKDWAVVKRRVLEALVANANSEQLSFSGCTSDNLVIHEGSLTAFPCEILNLVLVRAGSLGAGTNDQTAINKKYEGFAERFVTAIGRVKYLPSKNPGNFLSVFNIFQNEEASCVSYLEIEGTLAASNRVVRVVNHWIPKAFLHQDLCFSSAPFAFELAGLPWLRTNLILKPFGVSLDMFGRIKGSFTVGSDYFPNCFSEEHFPFSRLVADRHYQQGGFGVINRQLFTRSTSTRETNVAGLFLNLFEETGPNPGGRLTSGKFNCVTQEQYRQLPDLVRAVLPTNYVGPLSSSMPSDLVSEVPVRICAVEKIFSEGRDTPVPVGFSPTKIDVVRPPWVGKYLKLPRPAWE
jgi:hypothetical protein